MHTRNKNTNLDVQFYLAEFTQLIKISLSHIATLTSSSIDVATSETRMTLIYASCWTRDVIAADFRRRHWNKILDYRRVGHVLRSRDAGRPGQQLCNVVVVGRDNSTTTRLEITRRGSITHAIIRLPVRMRTEGPSVTVSGYVTRVAAVSR